MTVQDTQAPTGVILSEAAAGKVKALLDQVATQGVAAIRQTEQAAQDLNALASQLTAALGQ